MKQIATIGALLVILLVAVMGCLAIFGIMDFELSSSIAIKYGAAIILLCGCAMLATLLLRGRKESPD